MLNLNPDTTFSNEVNDEEEVDYIAPQRLTCYDNRPVCPAFKGNMSLVEQSTVLAKKSKRSYIVMSVLVSLVHANRWLEAAGRERRRTVGDLLKRPMFRSGRLWAVVFDDDDDDEYTFV
ncbi:jg4333 [Pararge aegeria aegeria]|uniref:Jg4333 protein n=1 Tax=Pararge aegeria aegeria TaxID=348720 RepID=A0A8S4SGG5_9NEOP|nr:jg4333 [Pararge aegeria aegeria]